MTATSGRVLRCAVHLHSDYSDGSGAMEAIAADARAAGVDVLVLTDHNKADAAHDGWEGWHDGLLVVVGVEFATRRHHLLALGIHDRVATKRMDTPEAARLLGKLKATVFAAHPQGRTRVWRLLNCWTREDLALCDGLEAWTYMHDWLERFRPWRLPDMCRNPSAYITGPDPGILAAWDALAEERRTPGLGSQDNHAMRLPLGLGRLLGWARGGLLPYGHVFRDFAHYVIVPTLTGETHPDVRAVHEALREGRGWMAHDALHPGGDFRFRLTDAAGAAHEVGAEVPFAEGMRLGLSSPLPARLRIWRMGEVIAEAEDTGFSWSPDAPGAYRATAELDGRAWVLTNHIALRKNAPRPI